jgi:hypothetical protein
MINDKIDKFSIIDIIVNYQTILARIRQVKESAVVKTQKGLFLIVIIKNLRNRLKDRDYLNSHYTREKSKRDTVKLYTLSKEFSQSRIFNSNKYLKTVSGYLVVTGWTNSVKILRAITKNSTIFKAYKRKDLKSINNAIAFTVYFKINDSAEWNSIVLDYLNQTGSLKITSYFEQETASETMGYIDDITVYMKLNFRFRYKYKFRVLNSLLNLDKQKILTRANSKEQETIFHFFHILINSFNCLSEYKRILKIDDLSFFRIMHSVNFAKTYVHYLNEGFGECVLCNQRITTSQHHKVVKINNLIADESVKRSIYAIKNAKVLNKSIILDSNNNLVNLSRQKIYENEFYSDHWDEVVRNNQNSDLYTIRKESADSNSYDEVIFIGGRNSSNFYHASIEILPNIASLTGIDKKVPIVLDERFSIEMSEFVKKLSKRDVIRKTNKICIKANTLFVLPLSSYVIDVPLGFNGECDFSIDAELLSKWRELVLSEVGERESIQTTKKRIFIKRDGNHIVLRGIKNKKVFESNIKKYGFEIIIPQNYSLSDQVKIFNSAHTVIMEEGSACANIIFMKPGTNLILLKAYRAKNFELFKTLAEYRNIRFYEVISKFDFTNVFYQNFWEATNKLYKISMRDLKKSIMWLESK